MIRLMLKLLELTQVWPNGQWPGGGTKLIWKVTLGSGSGSAEGALHDQTFVLGFFVHTRRHVLIGTHHVSFPH